MAVYTTIDDPEAYFQTKLFTGTGSSFSTTFDGSTDLQPNMMWFKCRSGVQSHLITDSVRGTTKRVRPDTGDAEDDQGVYGVQSFNTDGFTTGTGGNHNADGETFVGWAWKESATAGFDIVAADGTGSARTQAHSLSAVPEWIFTKELDNAGSWYTYTESQGNGKALFLNATNAVGTSSGYWNDTSPTSSVFSLGTDGGVNQSSTGYIFYLWRSVQGFSKFGSFLANSNVNGPFVYTGFRPAMVIVKVASDANNWAAFDAKRSPINPVDDSVYPDTDAAENTSHVIDFLSNGFKIRDSDGTINSTGNTYVYMAFAEQPFVNSEGVPNNAR